MTLRSKILAAALVLVTGGAAYAQSTMSCCEDCECCQEMTANRQGNAEAEPAPDHSQREGM